MNVWQDQVKRRGYCGRSISSTFHFFYVIQNSAIFFQLLYTSYETGIYTRDADRRKLSWQSVASVNFGSIFAWTCMYRPFLDRGYGRAALAEIHTCILSYALSCNNIGHPYCQVCSLTLFHKILVIDSLTYDEKAKKLQDLP